MAALTLSRTGSAYTPPPTASDLLSRISHEMRTPLNAVIGFATLLRANEDGRLGELELHYLDRITASGHELLGIVGDMLDVARIETGRMALQVEQVPVTPLVRSALTGLEPRAAARGVALGHRLPTTLSWLETDVTRLQQTISRLVASVVDTSANGTVTVSIDEDILTGRPLRIRVLHVGEVVSMARADQLDAGGVGVEIARVLCRLMGYELVGGSRPGERAYSIELERGA
ncbi:MAG TPA: histidine kinase dimerization/phospho-acceptor domain-containing protein [Gemmatimonadales bacterium]